MFLKSDTSISFCTTAQGKFRNDFAGNYIYSTAYTSSAFLHVAVCVSGLAKFSFGILLFKQLGLCEEWWGGVGGFLGSFVLCSFDSTKIVQKEFSQYVSIKVSYVG